MRTSSACALVLSSFLLGGCVAAKSIFGGEPKEDQATLARGLTCRIPTPSVSDNVNAAQTLTMTHGGKVYTFDAQIQMIPGRTDLVALDGLGRRAMTISWHKGQIESSRASWVPALVRPADVLATLMIVYLPLDAVAPALSACDAKLTETADRRVVTHRKQDVIVVKYDAGEGWNRGAHLHTASLDLRIDIKSLELAQ